MLNPGNLIDGRPYLLIRVEGVEVNCLAVSVGQREKPRKAKHNIA